MAERSLNREANRRGTSLLQAHLREANLTGATYTAETWWPNGFDPQSHGALLME